MAIETMPPQIKLVCDVCQEPASTDGVDFSMWDATDAERALIEAAFSREPDGTLICDDCAWSRARPKGASSAIEHRSET